MTLLLLNWISLYRYCNYTSLWYVSWKHFKRKFKLKPLLSINKCGIWSNEFTRLLCRTWLFCSSARPTIYVNCMCSLDHIVGLDAILWNHWAIIFEVRIKYEATRLLMLYIILSDFAHCKIIFRLLSVVPIYPIHCWHAWYLINIFKLLNLFVYLLLHILLIISAHWFFNLKHVYFFLCLS